MRAHVTREGLTSVLHSAYVHVRRFLLNLVTVPTLFLSVVDRFIQLDYHLRPYITGHEREDKQYRPGAQILKVYNMLTEKDALMLTQMPKNTEALMRWNASLRNIAMMVRNHTSGDLHRA